MSPNTSVFFIVSAITLSLLTISITLTTSAMASSKGGGSVAQEQVRTGNSNLDKEINKFYSCISKTHQDPPSIEKVDNCYSQALGGSGIGGGSGSSVMGVDTSPTTGHHHHNK
jgi:lipopolysaccharide/colanic/teichoic acid biosynthesis glycosyltransferase